MSAPVVSRLNEDMLNREKRAMVANLTSMGHQMSDVRFDDINFNNGKDYNKWSAYGQSKTVNILFTVALQRS